MEAFEAFTVWRFIWNNLCARPVRSGVSTIAIALQVFLILLIVGLTTGVVAEWGKRVEGVGADILIQPPNSSIFFAASSAVMQDSIGEQIAQLPGVDVEAPVLIVVDPRSLNLVYGIDFARFDALSKGFLFIQGRPFQAADEVLADDIIAATRKLHVGDKVTLLGHEFTTVGIVAHGKGARFFISLEAAQDIAGAEKRVSLFYVRSKGDTEGTRAQLVKLLPNYRIRSMSEYLTLMNSEKLPELKPFIRSMVGLGVAIGFLVVLLTMYTMVLERTREIGILKALGSTRADIIRLLLQEALFLATIGVVLGLACTYGVRAVILRTTPTLTILIPPGWVARAVALAIFAAVAGALYPAYRGARYDPVEALAYE